VVVVCPKCKTKLKVDDAKLSPQGVRFKCPKCGTVLLVKKPAVQEKKALDEKKVLIAHSNPSVVENLNSLLNGAGYRTVVSGDGIDAMVKALKELPLFCIVEVALPKIYGFEVCKRLKARPETRDIKLILVPSIYDKTKYRREPVSLYGADDYIEEHELSTRLLGSIERIKNGAPAEQEKPATPAAGPEVQPTPQPSSAPIPAEAPSKPQPAVQTPPTAPAEEKTDEFTEKAKRLARTIINDIYLYNSGKVEESIRRGNFFDVFAAEVKEGQKLYDNRIPQEIRSKADFYREAIDNFLAAKKKTMT